MVNTNIRSKNVEREICKLIIEKMKSITEEPYGTAKNRVCGSHRRYKGEVGDDFVLTKRMEVIFPWATEIKSGTNINLSKWWKQAVNQAKVKDKKPLLIICRKCKKNRFFVLIPNFDTSYF